MDMSKAIHELDENQIDKLHDFYDMYPNNLGSQIHYLTLYIMLVYI